MLVCSGPWGRLIANREVSAVLAVEMLFLGGSHPAAASLPASVSHFSTKNQEPETSHEAFCNTEKTRK